VNVAGVIGKEALDIIAIHRSSAVEAGGLAERLRAAELAKVKRRIVANAPWGSRELARDRSEDALADYADLQCLFRPV
jgi:hypothetical protein